MLTQSNSIHQESLWGPAPAVNPNIQRSSSTVADQSSKSADKKKKGAKRKAVKTDATSLLGFTVGASSTRMNVGEIEKIE